jgi:hypothetical protein
MRIPKMRGIGALALAGAASTALVLAGGVPAVAANTPVQFELGAGTLTISAPTALVDFGNVAAGATSVGGLLGPVVVTDNRGGATAWIATVASTAFVNGASTIPASDITYTPGTASTTGGVTLAVPVAGTLGAALIAQETTIVTGTNTATWNPNLTVAIPVGVTTGTYAATVTHSVA